MLNVFAFDEKYATLHSIGIPVDLRRWYDGNAQLTHMVFVCGQSEELVFIDDSMRARIYSLTTQQFRSVTIR